MGIDKKCKKLEKPKKLSCLIKKEDVKYITDTCIVLYKISYIDCADK